MSRHLKQHILDFVVAHPRITTLLAGFGIAVSFSLIGRLSLDGAHVAFAAPPDHNIPLEKFPVEQVPKDTLATLHGVFCQECIDKNPVFGDLSGK